MGSAAPSPGRPTEKKVGAFQPVQKITGDVSWGPGAPASPGPLPVLEPRHALPTPHRHTPSQRLPYLRFRLRKGQKNDISNHLCG